MTPEEVIKKIEEIRLDINAAVFQAANKLETLKMELGKISCCVWDTPQIDRINGTDPNGQYFEEVEIFQYCLAHGVAHRRAIAWMGDRGSDGTVQLLVPETRQWMATMQQEPTWSIPQRALLTWEQVFNSSKGA